MAPEVLEKIVENVPLHDRLNLRAECKRAHASTIIGNHFREYSKYIDMVPHKLQLKNSLHISIDIDNLATAQHFICLHQRSMKGWKVKNQKKARCWFTFPYEGPRDFSFFKKAQISHFNMDK
ncbi:hypothetical protein PENTCL1PPCAC_13657, partial [Pristionchus entomophagus]